MVYYDWVSDFDLMCVRHVEFFDFASIQMEAYDKGFEMPAISEFMHPTLMGYRVPISFAVKRARVVLDGRIPQRTLYEVWNTYQRPKITFAYFWNLLPDSNLLQTIGTYHPQIKNIKMVDSLFPKESEDTNHYLIDLRWFHDIHEFTFDVDMLLKRQLDLQTIYIQYVSEDKTEYYHYERNGDFIKKMLDMQISKSKHVVKILCTNLRWWVFNKNRIALPVVLQNQNILTDSVLDK
jgi:hypothetical protein